MVLVSNRKWNKVSLRLYPTNTQDPQDKKLTINRGNGAYKEIANEYISCAQKIFSILKMSLVMLNVSELSDMNGTEWIKR